MREMVENVTRRDYVILAGACVIMFGLSGFAAYSSFRHGKKGIVVPDNEEEHKLCICPSCPTFKGTPLTDVHYCAMGKANVKASQLGCICTNCPVFKKYQLRAAYFCVNGKSADIPQ
jgi:hypothetical protein